MIQVFKPVFHVDECLAEIRAVLESGWAGLGPKTQAFEEAMSERVWANHFVATNSCTSALQLALHAMDIEPGSRVLTTPITFVSANMVILQEGLVPVFCDVEPLTGNVDAGKLQHAIERHKPSAAIFPHIGGYPADMDAIEQVLGPQVPVIWDCSHALDAMASGSVVGAERLCCWSFQAVKQLAMGDGGGVSTNDDVLAMRLRRLRWCGIDKSTSDRSTLGYVPEYSVGELGFKAHMNDLASAIGLAELPYLTAGNNRRIDIAMRYKAEISHGSPPLYQYNRSSSYHFLPWFFSNRDLVATKLRESQIFPGMHYRRNDLYPLFRNCPKEDLSGAAWYEAHELTLPLHLAMSDDDVSHVIEVVNSSGGQ